MKKFKTSILGRVNETEFSGTFKVILVDFTPSSGHYKALLTEVGRLSAAGNSHYCQNEYRCCITKPSHTHSSHHSSNLQHLGVIGSSPPSL